MRGQGLGQGFRAGPALPDLLLPPRPPLAPMPGGGWGEGGGQESGIGTQPLVPTEGALFFKEGVEASLNKGSETVWRILKTMITSVATQHRMHKRRSEKV